MTTAQIIEKVNLLENQLEAIKWILVNLNKEKPRKQSVVKSTSGILNKNFPAGAIYEDCIRKSWDKHFRHSSQ